MRIRSSLSSERQIPLQAPRGGLPLTSTSEDGEDHRLEKNELTHLYLLVILTAVATLFTVFCPILWFKVTSSMLLLLFSSALTDEILFLFATFHKQEP